MPTRPKAKPRRCPCGQVFKPDRQHIKYCDPTCPSRPTRKDSVSPGNGGRVGRLYRRRVEELKTSGQPCYFCGGLIDTTLKSPHPYSHSVEHIIPVRDLAPGDPLMWAPSNTVSAHRTCNVTAGNLARQGRSFQW